MRIRETTGRRDERCFTTGGRYGNDVVRILEPARERLVERAVRGPHRHDALSIGRPHRLGVVGSGLR